MAGDKLEHLKLDKGLERLQGKNQRYMKVTGELCSTLTCMKGASCIISSHKKKSGWQLEKSLNLCKKTWGIQP